MVVLVAAVAALMVVAAAWVVVVVAVAFPKCIVLWLCLWEPWVLGMLCGLVGRFRTL